MRREHPFADLLNQYFKMRKTNEETRKKNPEVVYTLPLETFNPCEAMLYSQYGSYNGYPGALQLMASHLLAYASILNELSLEIQEFYAMNQQAESLYIHACPVHAQFSGPEELLEKMFEQGLLRKESKENQGCCAFAE